MMVTAAAFGFGAYLVGLGAFDARWIEVLRRWDAFAKRSPAELAYGVVGGITAILFVGMRIPQPVPLLMAAVAGAGGGIAVWRSRQASHEKALALRRSLLTPTLLDMLSITSATGMNLRTSLSTAVAQAPAEVQEMWQPVLAPTESSLVDVLQDVATGCRHVPTQRIVNALVITTERGTPVADVLQSMAQELRSDTRRQLLEIAAKKDVQMMLPVVFGILPCITAIALYPALGSLSAL